MKKETFLFFFLFAFSALSDTITTTYVCSDSSGVKHIQDRPCSGQSLEIPTVQHQQTFEQWIASERLHNKVESSRYECDRLRSSQSAADRRQAIELCKGFAP